MPVNMIAWYIVKLCLFFSCFVFETESFYVVQAELELEHAALLLQSLKG